jgi:hypothetical protein
MNERKLAELVAIPDYNVSGPLGAVAQEFEGARESWRSAAAEPGWEGISADMASQEFSRRSKNSGEQAESVVQAQRIVEQANQALWEAREAYSALPNLSLPGGFVHAIAQGIPQRVPGSASVVSTPAQLLSLVDTMLAQREAAAEFAVARFVATVDDLATRIGALAPDMDSPEIFDVIQGALEAVFGSGFVSMRPSLEDILRDYQVSDDPKGLREWPGWPLNVIVETEMITDREADMLNKFDLFALPMFRKLRNSAFDEADERFPSVSKSFQNDDQNDAFRHAYWNALMAVAYGTDWASRFATAHEGNPKNDAPAREAMDLYNNEVGRRIGEEHPFASNDELADYVEEALRNGELIVIAEDSTLRWSDADGATGLADPGPSLPGNAALDGLVAGGSS